MRSGDDLHATIAGSAFRMVRPVGPQIRRAIACSVANDMWIDMVEIAMRLQPVIDGRCAPLRQALCDSECRPLGSAGTCRT